MSFILRANVSDSNVSPELCCDPDNIQTLVKQLSMAESIFGRCPTCIKNAYKLLCDLSCNPEQSKFLNVTKTNENSEGKKYVTEIEVSESVAFFISFCDEFVKCK